MFLAFFSTKGKERAKYLLHGECISYSEPEKLPETLQEIAFGGHTEYYPFALYVDDTTAEDEEIIELLQEPEHITYEIFEDEELEYNNTQFLKTLADYTRTNAMVAATAAF